MSKRSCRNPTRCAPQTLVHDAKPRENPQIHACGEILRVGSEAEPQSQSRPSCPRLESLPGIELFSTSAIPKSTSTSSCPLRFLTNPPQQRCHAGCRSAALRPSGRRRQCLGSTPNRPLPRPARSRRTSLVAHLDHGHCSSGDVLNRWSGCSSSPSLLRRVRPPVNGLTHSSTLPPPRLACIAQRSLTTGHRRVPQGASSFHAARSTAMARLRCELMPSADPVILAHPEAIVCDELLRLGVLHLKWTQGESGRFQHSWILTGSEHDAHDSITLLPNASYQPGSARTP